MKKTTKFKLTKFCLFLVVETIFCLILIVIGNYGEYLNKTYIYIESSPKFIPTLIGISLLFAILSTLTENFFYDNWIRLFVVKKIKKEFKMLKKNLNYSIRKMQIEIEKPEESINKEKYLENFDDTRSSILNRSTYEIKQGDVDHRSLKEVIDALEDNDVKEVVATSDSPINIWFITGMIGYIVVQIRESLKKSAPIKRYIIENSENGNTDLVKKFNSSTDKYDEYGVIKKIHSNAIDLYIIPDGKINDIKWRNKSILKIKFNTKKDRLWAFIFNESEFKYCFTEITNKEQLSGYYDYINKIQNIVPKIKVN